MPQSEIDAVRGLLSAKPRPVGWEERRRRIEEVGAVWPVVDDVKLELVDLTESRANGRSFPATTHRAC
jgi:epsilon-lactone hydrolase